MQNLTELLAHGTANAWLFVPTAILLGALHGLEPGHSKTMMAAFIIAVRGTVGQAVLLGLAATVSHTAVVWAIALAGLHYGAQWNTAATEPYLQMISAILIIAIALWTLSRMPALSASARRRDHDHDHDHGHGHGHGDAPPHDHSQGDAHAAAHAAGISRRFAGSASVTTWQIIGFGLTGGLIPCPAALTILLICLQLKQLVLGASLVLCFSIGLALTMVSFGVAAALGMQGATSRWPGLTALAARAPYLSSLLIIAVGAYTFYLGLSGLTARA